VFFANEPERYERFLRKPSGFFDIVNPGCKSTGRTSSPGFDSLWERISQDLTTFVLSVVGNVPVDSEAPVETLSILRICWPSPRRCS
jgi:hypothetical protein